MTWDTSVGDLRALISDGETDKYNFRKEVFGQLDGTNKTFKTLEVRRITDLSDVESPLGVFVDGSKVKVKTDFPETGEFTVVEAPDAGAKLEASYYSQWFLDSELSIFLRTASQWCLALSDVTSVPPGLQPATVHFAAAECYQKLSLRFARLKSDEFRVEDSMSEERMKQAEMYESASKIERETAETLRKQFYANRGDQALAPLFNNILGAVPSVQPKR